MACLFAQPHQNYNYNIEQPPLRNVRGHSEWKSDNYGISETTSTQNGRKDVDIEWAGPTPTWIKFGRVILGTRSLRPTAGPPAQDSSARKISPHNFWLQKLVRIDSVEKLLESQTDPLKELMHRLTYSDTRPLSSSTVVAA